MVGAETTTGLYKAVVTVCHGEENAAPSGKSWYGTKDLKTKVKTF